MALETLNEKAGSWAENRPLSVNSSTIGVYLLIWMSRLFVNTICTTSSTDSRRDRPSFGGAAAGPGRGRERPGKGGERPGPKADFISLQEHGSR